MKNQFLPICKRDLEDRGWNELDIIIVTGDAYVDHPSYGAAVIGRVLETEGFKVGIIAQPDWKKKDDFLKLGRPRLFFGVTAGNLDSCLSNYTANRKLRHKDAYSPGGKFGLRPNRATLVYSNKIRECFQEIPIILGGIESSLTRLAHYHFWTQDVRRSILVDAKADLLIYGMGETQVVQVAKRLSEGVSVKEINNIQGTVVVRRNVEHLPKNGIFIPSYEEVATDKNKYCEAFKLNYFEQDPYRGKAIIQKHGDRYVVQYPPAKPLSKNEIDQVYELPYQRRWHPSYDSLGGVPGFETVRFSIISHRGCSAECSFCSIYAHQGRMIQSRSKDSILREVKTMTQDPAFKGTITDIGGPTANLYEANCTLWENGKGACRNKQCMMPSKCKQLNLGYEETISLWDEVLKIPKVKHLFVASGLRYDLLLGKDADSYLRKLCARHVSGLLKVAPEHLDDRILRLMNKPSYEVYESFAEKFKVISRDLGKNQFLVNYFISAHPGSSLEEAKNLALHFAERHVQPEQIQDFIPLPMTISSCMHYTGKHPLTDEKVYVVNDEREKYMQRAMLQYKKPENSKWIEEALQKLNRQDLKSIFLRKTGFNRAEKPKRAADTDLDSMDG